MKPARSMPFGVLYGPFLAEHGQRGRLVRNDGASLTAATAHCFTTVIDIKDVSETTWFLLEVEGDAPQGQWILHQKGKSNSNNRVFAYCLDGAINPNRNQPVAQQPDIVTVPVGQDYAIATGAIQLASQQRVRPGNPASNIEFDLKARGMDRLLAKSPVVACNGNVNTSDFLGPPEHRYGKAATASLTIKALGIRRVGPDIARVTIAAKAVNAEWQSRDNLISEIGLTCTVSADR